ncbi:MAG: hypothetical protein P8L85_15075 [Rubripirellula sp.]|nr:hypothetical protein [Rubripirellula sp.]
MPRDVTSGLVNSFEAGSVEEHTFLRNQDLQARETQRLQKVEEESKNARDLANDINGKILRAIKGENDKKEETQDFGVL